MNKIIAVLVSLLMLAAPVLAQPIDVRTEIEATGTTYYNQYSSVSGYDWTEFSAVTTGYVDKEVNAKGDFYFGNEVRSTGAWELQEDAEMWGSGPANIKKEVAYWTEDTSLTQSGKLRWPTEVNIYTFFGAGDVDSGTPGLQYQVVNKDNFNGVADEAPAEVVNYFNKQYLTPEPYYHTQSVGINMPTRCERNPISYPDFPLCETGDCGP